MAVPPPLPEVCPLARLAIVDLSEANLTQWASYIQDVTSGMRKPPQAAADCPQEDIIGVLHKLETLTPVKFCHLCFGLGNMCRCSKVPHQAPSQGPALWVPPAMSYATMVSTTLTTASSSVAGVSPMMLLPPGPPPGFPALMDTLPVPSTGNLLELVQ